MFLEDYLASLLENGVVEVGIGLSKQNNGDKHVAVVTHKTGDFTRESVTFINLPSRNKEQRWVRSND